MLNILNKNIIGQVVFFLKTSNKYNYISITKE